MEKLSVKKLTFSQIKLVSAVAVSLLVGGASTTAVLAAIPNSSDGTIHACYQTSGVDAGQVRIIDASNQSCNEDESAISWSSSAAPTENFVSSLVGADLSGSDLRYRNLSGYDLRNTNLTNTNLTGANLNEANLSGVTFGYTVRMTKDAKFTNANFSNAIFGDNLLMEGADFSDADFSGATAGQNVTFNLSNFSGVDFRTAGFVASSMPAITGSDLTNANFSGMDLSGMVIQTDVVTNTDFSNANLSGSWLSMTNLTDANLSGVTWSNTQCPDTTNSDDNGGTCVGHLDPSVIQ
jgi:uncharacterized protein YjbI with pentapeptide repeats